MSKTKFLLALAITASTVACSSDDDDPSSTSGVSTDKVLADTTPAEQAMLCDWASERQGGYGYSKDCGNDLVVEVPANQAECLADNEGLTECVATVGQFEACAREVSKDLCDVTAFQRPACEALVPCL